MAIGSLAPNRGAPARRETMTLISSDKVEGTAVYRRDGMRIGKIVRVMIDKVTGEVAYVVMSFGGFMGIGEDYYPLPWEELVYDERLDGYEVSVTEEQLKRAPRCSTHESWDWSDRSCRRIDEYYDIPMTAVR